MVFTNPTQPHTRGSETAFSLTAGWHTSIERRSLAPSSTVKCWGALSPCSRAPARVAGALGMCCCAESESRGVRAALRCRGPGGAPADQLLVAAPRHRVDVRDGRSASTGSYNTGQDRQHGAAWRDAEDIDLSSKAADMQELVRRLFRMARRHGFSRVRVTHTPQERYVKVKRYIF